MYGTYQLIIFILIFWVVFKQIFSVISFFVQTHQIIWFSFFLRKAEEISPHIINKHGHFYCYHQNFQDEIMWRPLQRGRDGMEKACEMGSETACIP